MRETINSYNPAREDASDQTVARRLFGSNPVAQRDLGAGEYLNVEEC